MSLGSLRLMQTPEAIVKIYKGLVAFWMFSC